MDYEILGIYTNMRKAAFGSSLLYQAGDRVYEVREYFHDSLEFTIRNSTVIVNDVIFPLKRNNKKILAFPNLIFICYRKVLEIYSNKGELLKEVESIDDIFVGSYGFLIYNKTPFIVNFEGNFIFVCKSNNVLNFTEDGVIFSICGDETTERTEWNEENKSKGTFSIQSLKMSQEYTKDGECIFEEENFKIFRETALIEDVIICTSIKIESLECFDENINIQELKSSAVESSTETFDGVIVLCKKFLFVIAKGLVIRKNIESFFTKIIPQRFVVHNYVSEASFFDCILLINCFKPIKLIKIDGIVCFLSNMFNFSQALALKFIKNLKINSLKYNIINFESTMCKVYRLVDDSSKKVIDSWIDFNSLTSDQLYLVIIYKLELLSKFISLCKSDKKLFYLEDLKDFYIKTGNTEMFRKELLRQNLLIFKYKGLELMNQTESEEIESQRLLFMAKLIMNEN